METEYEYVTTNAKVEVFEATSGVFAGLITEMRELSKKKPDATLSKSKVKILNRVISDMLECLQDEPEGKYLAILDDSELPQNSDAVLMMVQFEKALKSFKSRYTEFWCGQTFWITEENIAAWNADEDEDEDEDGDDI